MPVKLYFLIASPPARAVQVTLKTLNVPHEVVNVDLVNGEHKSETFLKLNPQHTVPVIIDEDGFSVSDRMFTQIHQSTGTYKEKYQLYKTCKIPEGVGLSKQLDKSWVGHAINAYLVSKYAKDDKLYPKDLKVRSTVDHRLYFDCGVLFQCVKSMAIAFLFEKSATSMTPSLSSRFIDAYETLERFLASTQYIAADHITIADFSILTTLGNAQLFVPLDKEKFPKLSAYIQRGYANIPSLEEGNKAAIGQLKEFFKDFNF